MPFKHLKDCPLIPFRDNKTGIMTIMLLCFTGILTAGNVITVTNSNDSGGGSLRVAINNLASDGDTIRFAASTYGDTIRLTSGHIIISKNIAIMGLGDDSTYISGNSNSRIFYITAGDTVDIQKLSLINGTAAADSGGAIYNNGALSMRYCILKDNTAAHGGAIVNNASLMLSACLLTNNVATAGLGGSIFSSAGTFTADNCTISGSTSVSGGGGIACKGDCTFIDITVNGNFSNTGGGIYALNSININSSAITGNNANFGHGGGIYNAGNAKITSCVFDDNHVNNPSFHGGGIYNSSIFQLISSSVNDNSSAGMGGGIMNDATLTVLASTISNNLSTAAGGGIASQGRANFFSSTISNNDAGTSGGGIYSSATVLISRCTITENESGSNGGGIFSSDSLTFFNTIIAGNAADNQGPEIFNSSGTPVSSGYNVVRDIAQSGFIPLPSDTAGTTANPVEALLGPLQNNGGTLLTHEPLCGSPAIDNGDTTGAPSTDQRGLPRIHGKGIDIGSVETQFDDITIQAVINNVSAPGNADGSIQLLVTGGTEPYFYLWNNGSQTHTITGLSAGGYSVTVTDLKGCDASAIFTVNVANGILEALGKVSLTLFPNPAQDFIFIQTEKKQISLIFFYNTDGKVVKKAECSGFTELIKLPVTELPKGIYRVLVKYENGNFAAGRFVKGE